MSWDDPTPFLHFCDYLPCEKDQALYLNKLGFPLLNDNLPKGLIEIGPLVLEKILEYFWCIFTPLLLSPLRERHRPSFE
jgi:hypothetical protein